MLPKISCSKIHDLLPANGYKIAGKFFLTFLLFLSFFHSPAQVSDSVDLRGKQYVFTYDGKLILYSKVEKVKKIFKPLQIIADGRFLDPESIQFIKTSEGLFANIQKVSGTYEGDFLPCEIEGKINKFSKYTAYAVMNPMTGGIQTSGTSKEYINKGFSDIRKLNYKNILELTKDNPACVNYMKKVKRGRDIRLGLLLSGVAFLVPGLFLLNSTDVAPYGIATGAGLMLIANFSSLVIPSPEKAIEIYNLE